MKSSLIKSLLALLAAIIWGFAFVAQSVSADTIGPFTFNAIRGIIAFIFLVIVILIIEVFNRNRNKEIKKMDAKSKKMLILGGIVCGTILTIASALQQKGIEGTEAGKAGFITAAYIVLVPVFGIFFRKKTSPFIWLSVIIAVSGLYLICMNGAFTISKYDIFVILCSIAFAFHILSIDYFVAYTDGIKMSCIQFLTEAILSSICMLIFEKPDIHAILNNIWPLLYVGVMSSGVAYTLQIVAQKNSNPTVISILLSLESVFSVIAGAILIQERLELREYLGCILMFIAVILAQLPIEEWLKQKRKQKVQESN